MPAKDRGTFPHLSRSIGEIPSFQMVHRGTFFQSQQGDREAFLYLESKIEEHAPFPALLKRTSITGKKGNIEIGEHSSI